LKAVGAGAALSALGLDVEAEAQGEKEGSPFDPDVQREALRFVARVMNVTPDPNVAPLPVVWVAESVSDIDFNKMIGFDTEGKRQNLFFPPIFCWKKVKCIISCMNTSTIFSTTTRVSPMGLRTRWKIKRYLFKMYLGRVEW
jgi:hypothetical protein